MNITSSELKSIISQSVSDALAGNGYIEISQPACEISVQTQGFDNDIDEFESRTASCSSYANIKRKII